MSDIMWSVAQIAERDGVSKAAVSKTVKKLLADRPETPVERGSQGQVLGISLAHYDHYRQRFVNPAKASAPLRHLDDDKGASDDDEDSLFSRANTRSSNALSPADSFEEAARQEKWIKVSREKIRHQEDCGLLLRRDATEKAVAAVGSGIQAIVKRLPNRAEDLALAVSKEGLHGVRTLLRQIAFELSNQIADRLDEIAKAAPADDELIEDSI